MAAVRDIRCLDSPAVGTGIQARPCGDQLRASKPRPSPDPHAVTLSGGGFRATLAGVGALRLLASVGRLGQLRYLSSVSGGSIANGVTALAWPALRRLGFTADAFDENVVEPIVRQISRRSLKMSLIRGMWRTVGPMNRTELLARRLDEWFFAGAELEGLDPEARWVVSAANLVTGARFTFERDVLGDYAIGLRPTAGTGLRLSTAVAASAAVPGAFAPLVIEQIHFPCASQPPVLVDGGAYDNMGLEAVDGERYSHTFLMTLNAGGLLRPGAYGKVPLVRELVRANSLLYRQSTSLRAREMVNRFQVGRGTPPGEPVPRGGRRGVLVGLATDFAGVESDVLDMWRSTHPEHRAVEARSLALVPTVFDKLDERLCRALVYRGWWLMGAALAAYHPERLPDPAAVSPPPT